MPFDFAAYDAKCNGLTVEELQREWEHYTRLISGASTSTAVSGMALPLTCGVSIIGVGMAAPAIHNARKKREIIERHLQKHGTTHHTRKRDVLSSMAISGTIGVVTLGVSSMGADQIATAGAEHGISAIVENETAIKVVTHAALDGAGMVVEHAHTSHKKEKDAHKAFQAAGVFQAVQDAKAQEAGYSIQPYNPQNFAGSSTAQVPQAQAYGYHMQPPPAYSAAPYGFVPDSKTPAVYVQSNATASTYAVQPALQQYDPSQAQYQVHPQTGAYGLVTPTVQPQIPAPTGESSVQPTAYPVPDTNSAAQIQPGQQPQGRMPAQQYQQNTSSQLQIPQTPAPAYSPGTAYGTYDMNSMRESLPAPTPTPEAQQYVVYSSANLQEPQPVHATRAPEASELAAVQATQQQYPAVRDQPAHTGDSDPQGPPPPSSYTSLVNSAVLGLSVETQQPEHQQSTHEYPQSPPTVQGYSHPPQGPQPEVLQYQGQAQEIPLSYPSQYIPAASQQAQPVSEQYQPAPISGQMPVPTQAPAVAPTPAPVPSHLPPQTTAPTPAPTLPPTPASTFAPTPLSVYSSPAPQQQSHTPVPMGFPPPPPPPAPSINKPLEATQVYVTPQVSYAPAPIAGQAGHSVYQASYQPQQFVQAVPQQYPQQLQQQLYQPAPVHIPVQVHTPPYSPAPASQHTGTGYFPANTIYQHGTYPQQQLNVQLPGQAPYTPAATPAVQYPPQPLHGATVSGVVP